MHEPTEGRKRRGWRGLAVIAAVLAVFGGGAAAYAAVAVSPQTNTIGAGGYDATTTSTAGMTSNQAVVAGDQYGLTVAGGRHGVSLCNSTTSEKAAIGLFSGNLNTDYAVQYGAGTAACPAGELSPLATFPALAAVPFGHHVWVSERLVTRTKTIRILVCILNDRHGKPVPVPTPSESVAPAATSTASPTGSPTETASTTAFYVHHAHAGNPVPAPNIGGPNGEPGGDITGFLPGFKLKCFIITKTFTKNVVVFEAQDLDAPVATPTSGDLAGVQFAVVHVPAGTTFNHATAGISANTTALTACAGAGFPIPLAGAATYSSAACQPVSVFEFAGFTDGTGPFTDYQSGTTTELISPSAGGALVAPNQSITTTNLGPHGTAPGASLTGSHFVAFTGNAPVS